MKDMTDLNVNQLLNITYIFTILSYLDLSFVNYDKFNRYEKQIDKMLNRLYIMTNKIPSPSQSRRTIGEDIVNNKASSVVMRRRLKKISSVGDFNKNLDREKNVYRQSIDSNKLKFLSSINLDSHRWSQTLSEHNDPMQWLSLEKQSNVQSGIK